MLSREVQTMDQTLFLGVPFHAGQGHLGTALAPAAFRESLPAAWQDLGDVAVYPGRAAFYNLK